MGTVIVQVSTAEDDFFREIDEDRLKEIASRLRVAEIHRGRTDHDLATLDGMRKDFWESSREARVYRTSEADYGLVLDGSDEHESWTEMLEAWEAELDG